MARSFVITSYSIHYTKLYDIASVEVKRKGEVRRAKLYYLRQRSGKSARIREKVRGTGASGNAAASAGAAASAEE